MAYIVKYIDNALAENTEIDTLYRKDIKTNVAAKISFILNITCKIKDFLRITRSTKVHYGKILLQREQYFHRDILTRGEHI